MKGGERTRGGYSAQFRNASASTSAFTSASASGRVGWTGDGALALLEERQKSERGSSEWGQRGRERADDVVPGPNQSPRNQSWVVTLPIPHAPSRSPMGKRVVYDAQTRLRP